MKQQKWVSGITAALLVMLAACQAAPTAVPAPVPTENPTPAESAPSPTAQSAQAEDVSGWWNDVVFYEIFVRSFKDSDGDGIGDFQGIIQQLDYLNDGNPETKTDLGIGALWLMPINPSPSYHGYDVTDYKAVNPDYGTLDDFKQLLDACHARGIRVIMDFVVNHTSTQHPWFKAAAAGDAKYKDYYVWSDKDPGSLGPWGQRPWYRAANGKFYYAVFWDQMPDLNYHNPDVTAEIQDASAFWLGLGVDGFRVDAARYLYEEGAALQDTKGTIQWFQDWRAFYKPLNPQAYTVGEVWTDLQITAKYAYPKGLDSLFMFDLAEDIKGAAYSGDASLALKSYLDVLGYFPDGQFSTFLSNHDQQRVMSYFGGKESKARVAAFIYLTGPGTPFVYYGEEIGMTGSKPDENLRTPMQWSAAPNAGFTSGTPWEAVNQGWEETNAQTEAENPDSLLNWYKGLIHLRSAHPALRGGVYLPLTSSCKRVYAVLRQKDDDILLTLASTGIPSSENCTIALESSPLSGSYQVETLWGEPLFDKISFGADGSLKDFLVAPVLSGGQTLIVRLSQP
ncbi:MAG TPA: alpha-amylase family glycosyl hydrolase [Anaerolineaceae bacterium]|nr:alpha-amylase family glycosyl hydrolase [Anaerolineaceae bacterium]